MIIGTYVSFHWREFLFNHTMLRLQEFANTCRLFALCSHWHKNIYDGLSCDYRSHKLELEMYRMLGTYPYMIYINTPIKHLILEGPKFVKQTLPAQSQGQGKS